MKKWIHIALFLLIGFCMTPTDLYACKAKSVKFETKDPNPSVTQMEKKEGCSSLKGQCMKHGKKCSGKCDNLNCQCPSNQMSFLLPTPIEFSHAKVLLKKPSFYYLDLLNSKAFFTIWLPPKIG
ncbi:hypothetical protein [Flavobacterium sp.]|mgnify:CR=1 FL=1|uniref:hypothetical protein n=1 Tax=Flavobacterium sp. TaxID=239 RepID=UPI002FD8CB4C